MSKIKKIKSITIYDDELVKKIDDDYEKTFSYLESRGFTNFLKYNQRIDDASYYPYIKNIEGEKYQKGEDLIDIVSDLHNKTSFNKEITPSKYKKIYNNTLGYIKHLEEYYFNLLESIEILQLPSPSQIIFLDNYTKLLTLFDYLKEENDAWYNLVNNKEQERVVLNHGNLSLEHLLQNKNAYLISWGKANFDSPIIDIVNLYHNEWDNLEFKTLLNNYINKINLSEEEKKLLFINLAIPKKIKIYEDEYQNVKEMRILFDYIYKTENLIRPYYTEQKKE